MYCKNCGNKLNDNDKFCAKCGTKKDIQILQQTRNYNENNIVNSKDNIKTNFLLSNLIVFLLFIANMCLLFLGTIISLFKSLMDSPSGSGWFLIAIPFFAGVYVIPQFIGAILSVINLMKKNYIILIFSFIVSIISLIITICLLSSPLTDNIILFWIVLILNISLCIIILLKLILKIKE